MTSRNPRICFLTPEYPPHEGGVARSAHRLVNGLYRAGFDVVVFTPLWPTQDLSTFTEDNIVVHRIPFNQVSTMDVIEPVLDVINHEEGRRPFDIFHGFTLIAAYACLCFPPKGNRPVVASIRGIDGMEFDDMTAEVIRRSNWFTSVSRDSLNRMMSVRDISNCSTVISNGVDLRQFSPWRPTRTNRGVVGTVATFRDKKNIPLLIRSYARLPVEIRKQLLLVGESYCDNELSAEGRGPLNSVIEELGVTKEVEITGFVDNALVPEYHSRMRVFVLSSDHEGLPNAILEAAASGMPIVATAVDGVKDIFTNGKDALLVEPGDVDQLTEAIKQTLTNYDLARRLSKGARLLAARLSPEAEVGKYIEIYRHLLEINKNL
jgi:L-malate glycosyltransferase